MQKARHRHLAAQNYRNKITRTHAPIAGQSPGKSPKNRTGTTKDETASAGVL